MKYVLIAGIVMLLILPLTAFAEEDILLTEDDVAITMDHPLHAVMMASLKGQEKLSKDNAAKSRALLRKASRWAVLAEKHANDSADLSEEAADEYANTMNEVDKLGPIIRDLAKQKDIEALVAAARSHHLAVLNAVLLKVPGSAAIGHAINVSSKAVNKTKTNSHLECVNQSCVTRPGVGTDDCTTNADCVQNQTHLACVNEACVVVDGAGTDECSTNDDCTNQTNQTQPDITVQSISVSSDNITNSTNVTVNITALIQNIGDDVANASTTTRFFIESEDLVQTVSLAAGASTKVSTLYILAPGNYTVTVNADWNDDVQESNENNNEKSSTFVV